MTSRVFVLALSVGLCSLTAQVMMLAANPMAAAAAPEWPAQDSSPAASKADCLKCHSYDEVVAATAAHVTSSGEKVNPHRYVEAGSTREHFGQPHQATGTEHIPDCSNCHTAHPIPPTGAVDRSRMNVEWCYSSCHHQNDFMRCSLCHQ
jgi:hypothetical protein